MKRTLLVAALLCAVPAHAATISADAIFDVVYRDDVTYRGEGSFSLRANYVTAFSFDMLGAHWSLEDIDPLYCPQGVCRVVDGEIDLIRLAFEDEQGGGFLLWDFRQGIFSASVGAGDIGFTSTSEHNVSGAFREFDATILPEPGTLALLSLGLLGLGLTRRATPSSERRRVELGENVPA